MSMGDKSKIEWTEATWNPIRGCTIVSDGCANCYAMREAWRHAGPGGAYEGLVRMTSKGPRWTGEVRFVDHVLDQPLRWTRPRMIFVNSMSDLFHESLTDEDIDRIFAVMFQARLHTFQVLTKRPQRMRDYVTGWYARHGFDPLVPEPHIWLGASAENQETFDERNGPLSETPAAVRWLSLEPLLGPIAMDGSDCRAVDWVVVGGESGPGARPMHPDWARSLRDQCLAAGVPFFFKQWGEWAHVELVGGRMKIHGSRPFPLVTNRNTCWLDDETPSVRLGRNKAGRELDGRTWDEYPPRAGLVESVAAV